LGKYTIYNDASVDQQIGRQISSVLTVILDSIQNDVQSVFLSGGFGRGEGSVKFSVDGKVAPLKDFDILILLKNAVDAQTKQKLNDAVYNALGFSNVEDDEFRFSDFVVDLSYTSLSNLQAFPDISIYELKASGSLLYGEDIRSQIPWQPQDIPIASGIRLLFEKMTGLIGHFPILGEQLTEKKKELLFYECNKSYVEIGTALCLMFKCYEPSYSKRKELLKANFSEMKPFSDQMPELLQKILLATDFKLKPDFRKVNLDPIEIWFGARNSLLAVSKFYLAQCLGLEDLTFYHRQLTKRLSRLYFEHIGAAAVKRYGKLSSLLRSPASSAFNTYMNYQYSKISKAHNQPYPKNLYLTPFTSINARLYSVAPLILLSIQENQEINQKYFDLAASRMRRLRPNIPMQTFSDLRLAYLSVYKCLPFH
jgi:hypothetical protein